MPYVIGMISDLLRRQQRIMVMQITEIRVGDVLWVKYDREDSGSIEEYTGRVISITATHNKDEGIPPSYWVNFEGYKFWIHVVKGLWYTDQACLSPIVDSKIL